MAVFKIKHCNKCGKDYPSCCVDECPHPRWIDTPEAKKQIVSMPERYGKIRDGRIIG